jgi:hypothetical protein
MDACTWHLYPPIAINFILSLGACHANKNRIFVLGPGSSLRYARSTANGDRNFSQHSRKKLHYQYAGAVEYKLQRYEFRGKLQHNYLRWRITNSRCLQVHPVGVSQSGWQSYLVHPDPHGQMALERDGLAHRWRVVFGRD